MVFLWIFNLFLPAPVFYGGFWSGDEDDPPTPPPVQKVVKQIFKMLGFLYASIAYVKKLSGLQYAGS